MIHTSKQKIKNQKRISIVIPAHNEEKNVTPIFNALKEVFKPLPYSFEVIFINDGSTDSTLTVCEKLESQNPTLVQVIDFSRNFGKEAATTAGLHEATGDAVMAIDADLQHPPKLIPLFIEKWEKGADVVVGVRKNTVSDSLMKRLGSRFYYKVINAISKTPIIPRATDFRLIDRQVVDKFNRLTERNRMTRGLIDWLGFRRDYIYFEAAERMRGEASYSFWKLVVLAMESFIAHSLFPLRIAGYLGIGIVLFSGVLGAVMFYDRYIRSLGFAFSGSAILADITLFLVGVVLVILGLFSFYIGQIYKETQNRPLYVIRKRETKEEENTTTQQHEQK